MSPCRVASCALYLDGGLGVVLERLGLPVLQEHFEDVGDEGGRRHLRTAGIDSDHASGAIDHYAVGETDPRRLAL